MKVFIFNLYIIFLPLELLINQDYLFEFINFLQLFQYQLFFSKA